MLTKRVKYALNALTFIARNTDKSFVRSDEISESQRIPVKFLESILTELVKSGILGSKKGKNGGYFLLRNAHDVQLVEIMRMFDGAIGLIPCVTYQYFKPCEDCEDVETCKIRKVYKDLRDLNVEFLKGKSLADIL